jgi:hypothetical protein
MRLPRHLLADRPWRSAARRRHRLLDEAGWAALDRDGSHVPVAGEVSVMTKPRVRR